MQHFDVLNQAGVNEVARGIGKATGIELVGQRHPVDEDSHAVAADAANVDALGAEAGSGRLVVHARDVAKDVRKRGREFGIDVGTGQHRHVGGNLPDRPGVLVRHDDDLFELFVTFRADGRRRDKRT